MCQGRGIQVSSKYESTDGDDCHAGSCLPVSAHCEHPLGAFENPLSRTQVEQKFLHYAATVLPDARIDKVIDAVNRLEDFGSVRELMTLLRAAPRARAIAAAE